MKRIIVTTCLLFLFLGTSFISKNRKLVIAYSEHYNSKNKEILALLSDDLLIDYQGQYIEVEGKEQFEDVLDWGTIMNSSHQLEILSEKKNMVVTHETFINDRDRILKIPSLEFKLTYYIKNNKIQRISTDTLSTGRSHIDEERLKITVPFQYYCDSTYGSYQFGYNRDGAEQLRQALLDFASRPQFKSLHGE